ncbi:MAG: hypothetical protein MUF12_09820 [Sediminibacterium sp.]|nr:hypothetical protein [Sediminibacterium sp.]
MTQKNNNGFKLLNTRSLNDPFNSQEFEEMIGFSLPPLYKAFLETFYMGSIRPNGKYDDGLQKEEFYSETFKNFYSLYYVNNVIYSSAPLFYKPEESISVFKEFIDDAELFFEHGIFDAFPIGFGNSVGGPILFVGIKEYNLDKIYVARTDSRKGVWTFLANNIFEFIRGFEIVEYTEEECKKYGFTYDKLYRNWGEDFWRVREENS